MQHNPRKSLILGSGKVLANYTPIEIPRTSLSVHRSPVRNTGQRRSHALSDAQCNRLREAARFAVAQRLWFTHFQTIHIERAGIPDALAAQFITKWLKRVRDLCRSHGSPFAAIWVRENGEQKGSHAHFLMSLPEGLPLARLQRRWLSRETGLPYRRGVLNTRPIVGVADKTSALYRTNLDAALKYVTKGRDGMQGEIVGKRCGFTQNLGVGTMSKPAR